MLTAIDQIANRNHLQIIKATVPYLPEREQKMISCLVKVLELRNVVRFFSHPPSVFAPVKESQTRPACRSF